MSVLAAKNIVKGDVVLLAEGWRNVLDVWESLGFIHVAASDTTGMWLCDEEVEVARRPPSPQRPTLHVVQRSPRATAHDRGDDCREMHCVACWRAGRRPSPVHRSDA